MSLWVARGGRAVGGVSLAGSLLLVLWACAQRAAPVPPRRHVVEIRGMEFQPAHLEAAAGDTVVWVNRDLVPHSATAAAGIGWDTGPFAPGESREQVLGQDGRVAYFCSLHPTMTATMSVGPPAREVGR